MKSMIFEAMRKRLFQSSEDREAGARASAMADELIELAQTEWSLQSSAFFDVVVASPSKHYAEVVTARTLLEIKTAFLFGHLYANSQQYVFPTDPKSRAFVLLLSLLHRDGMPAEEARQEVVALRRVLENGDILTAAIVYRGEASVKDPVFHPHLSDIVRHMMDIEASPGRQMTSPVIGS